LEGIQTTKDIRPPDRVYEYGGTVNTIDLHFVVFVVGLPQFRGGGKVLALHLAGYGPAYNCASNSLCP